MCALPPLATQEHWDRLKKSHEEIMEALGIPIEVMPLPDKCPSFLGGPNEEGKIIA